MNRKFLFLLILLNPFILFSQDTLPNLNFDKWTSFSAGAYEEPSGGVWATANKIVLMLMPLTTEKTTDAVSGTYAVKMTTKQANTLPPMLVTGTLCTGVFNSTATPPNNMKFGMPFTGKPSRFTGYYKYLDNNGDSCDIYATLTKWSGGQRIVVGKASLRSSETVSNYTKFDLSFSYTSSLIPDSISVVFASSAGGAQMVGHVGSTLYIDHVTLEYENGLTQFIEPSLKVNCFPVPTENNLFFKTERDVHGLLNIYNEIGKLISSSPISGSNFSLNVVTYKSGVYYYQIIEKNILLSTGTFSVN